MRSRLEPVPTDPSHLVQCFLTLAAPVVLGKAGGVGAVDTSRLPWFMCIHTQNLSAVWAARRDPQSRLHSQGCSQPPGLCKVSSESLRKQSQNTKTRARSLDSLSSTYSITRQGQKPVWAANRDPRTEVTAPGHRAAGDAGDAAVPAAPGSAQGHPPRPPGAPPGVPCGPPPCPRGHAWNPGWGRSGAVGRTPRLSRGGAGGGAHLIAEDAVRLVAPGGHGRAEPGLAGRFQVELQQSAPCSPV
jgi:hypothetical protein